MDCSSARMPAGVSVPDSICVIAVSHDASNAERSAGIVAARFVFPVADAASSAKAAVTPAACSASLMSTIALVAAADSVTPGAGETFTPLAHPPSNEMIPMTAIEAAKRPRSFQLFVFFILSFCYAVARVGFVVFVALPKLICSLAPLRVHHSNYLGVLLDNAVLPVVGMECWFLLKMMVCIGL